MNARLDELAKLKPVEAGSLEDATNGDWGHSEFRRLVQEWQDKYNARMHAIPMLLHGHILSSNSLVVGTVVTSLDLNPNEVALSNNHIQDLRYLLSVYAHRIDAIGSVLAGARNEARKRLSKTELGFRDPQNEDPQYAARLAQASAGMSDRWTRKLAPPNLGYFAFEHEDSRENRHYHISLVPIASRALDLWQDTTREYAYVVNDWCRHRKLIDANQYETNLARIARQNPTGSRIK